MTDHEQQIVVWHLEHRVKLACQRLERELDDGVAWDQLVAALLDSGRADEAICGLQLAADAGQIAAERYLHLVHRLHVRGELELAFVVGALAVHHFPTSYSAWMTMGYLCLEHGDEARAERAYATAQRLGG